MTRLGIYLETISDVIERKLIYIMNHGEFMDLSECYQDEFERLYYENNYRLLTINFLIDDIKHTKADEAKLYELFGI